MPGVHYANQASDWMAEAADKIEELEAEVQRLKELVQKINSYPNSYKPSKTLREQFIEEGRKSWFVLGEDGVTIEEHGPDGFIRVIGGIS